VQVEAADRDAGVPRDLVNRGRIEPICREERECRREQTVAGTPASLLPWRRGKLFVR
jgi:hypothetical protein